MTAAIGLALKAASCHVRNLRTRLPFRYGAVTLTRFPLLHLAVEVEAADERRDGGFAADNLPPKWFDKDPAKSFRDNVADQLASIRAAHEAYLSGGEAEASLRIDGGALAVGSLQAPGYGVAFHPDLDSLTPLAEWSFDSLEAAP
ncbi:MAG: hypothetical protein HYV93_05985 [Candidatus Rokubacteria bacterium]|nr:hypothetical protein [Candidatus Rokubacteria bacterium]